MSQTLLVEHPGETRRPSAVWRAAPAAAQPQIVFDLSRLLSRVLKAVPTGIDRVEMAYARRLLDLPGRDVAFAAVHPGGFYGRLPRWRVRDFIDATAARWEAGGASRAGAAGLARAGLDLARLAPLRRPSEAAPGMRIYLQVSPHHLHHEPRLRRKLHRENARFLCMVHDLIPIDFPEYARPGGDALHRRRIEAIARHADGVVAVSDATRRGLLPYLIREQSSARVISAPLGVEAWTGSPPVPARQAGPGHMVMLGTIEPRKNHALVLNVLRQLVQESGPGATPVLHLIGSRGWESENVRDLLDRSAVLKPVVIEANGLPDRAVRELIRSARALLMPSFAEGYGLPVAEALSLGTPVICSDIQAHREVGGHTPEYLDPTDGPAWREAILDYADPMSPRRLAQLSRIRQWRAPTWEAHLSAVLDFADSLCA